MRRRPGLPKTTATYQCRECSAHFEGSNGRLGNVFHPAATLSCPVCGTTSTYGVADALRRPPLSRGALTRPLAPALVLVPPG